MAYMDFRGLEPVTVGGPQARLAPRADDFTPLEWTVIALSRHERLSGVAKPGHARRLMALLFGDDPAGPLADPKLEALRRVAVPLWHGRRPSAAALEAFSARGFDAGQYALLRGNIAEAVA